MRRREVWRHVAATCAVVGLIGLFVAVPPPVVHGQQQAPVARDAIILLDITASLRGEGDDPKARDIWDQVLGKVNEQLDQLAVGTSLTIVPFANGPRYDQIWPTPPPRPDVPLNFTTVDGGSRQEAKKFLSGLEPNGQATWICDSLDYVLGQLDSRRQGTSQRIQTVYLYTDGLDTGKCAQNFASQFATIFNGHATDYPFLHTVYIDLNGQQTDQAKKQLADQTNGGVRVTTGFPDSLVLDTLSLNLGNFYEHPNGVPIKLRVQNPVPSDADYAASFDVIPPNSGLVIKPADVPITQEINLTVTMPTPPAQQGVFTGTIVLRPTRGNYNLANGGSIAINYSYIVPTPTATIAPTAIPAATVTPAATATPAPTATPRAVITVKNDAPVDLGTVKQGGKPLTGQSVLQVAYDPAATTQKSSADIVATIDGKEQVDRFWLTLPDGTHATRRTVRPDETSVPVGYQIAAQPQGHILPKTTSGAAQVAVTSPNASVQLVRNGNTADRLGYTYHTAYPMSGALIPILLLLLAAACVVGYAALHARFPAGAQVVVEGGESVALRPRSERSLRQRYFSPHSLRVGTFPSDVNVPGANGTAAYLSPRGSTRDFFGTKTMLRPAQTATLATSADDGAPAPPVDESSVLLGGTRITAPTRLNDGDTFTIGGTMLTYTAPSGGRALSSDGGYGDDDGYTADDDGGTPRGRRRGLGRRTARNDEGYDDQPDNRY